MWPTLYFEKKKKMHCSSSPKLLYSSRNRWKTLTMNIHLTTFWKLTAYFVFTFHSPFATCFHLHQCPGNTGAASCTWCTVLPGWLDLGRLAWYWFCFQYLCKAGEQKIFFRVLILQQNLQQIKNGWDQMAKLSQNMTRWNCFPLVGMSKSSVVLELNGCLCAFCDQSTAL